MANIVDFFENHSELNELSEIVNSVMEIPDDNLNSAVIEAIRGMIAGSLTPAIREQSIQQLLTSYRNNNLSRSAVKNEITSLKASVQEIITELKPSIAKTELLNSIFNIFFEIFEEAERRFITCDIELPMTLEEGAKAPTYAHETDACADIYALEDTTILAHSISNKVRTGLRIALPEGWVMKLAPRSSIGAKTGLRLSNSIGVIDADYRGEIGVLYDNISDSDYEIKAGDRIAQCWVEPVYQFKAVVVDALDETERGAGGFGSTGA